MAMAVRGLNFLVHHVPQEVFQWDRIELPVELLNGLCRYSWQDNQQVFVDKTSLDGVYPYLLVNIGSGNDIADAVLTVLLIVGPNAQVYLFWNVLVRNSLNVWAVQVLAEVGFVVKLLHFNC